MESEPMLTPREKSPLPEAHRRIEPMILHQAGQQAQHTTDCAIPAPSLSHSNPFLVFAVKQLLCVKTYYVQHDSVSSLFLSFKNY